MYCTKCAAVLGSTDLFCSNCGTRVKSPDASDDVQVISPPPRAPSLPSTRSSASASASMPSVRVSSSYAPSSASSLTSEVRAQKLATTKQDRANSKDILPTSSYSLDPRGKAQQQRTAELFTVEKGMAPIKVPGALKRLKLSPYQTIEDWSAWARDQAHGFKSWHTREDPKNFVKDETTLAFVGVVYSTGQGPAELEYDPGTPLGNLFADVPNNGKTKIALIVPVQNLFKEEAKTLALPLANKRAKSPTGVAIPKRGRRANRGGKGQRGGVKKEQLKEETKVKIEEEVEEDSDLPKVDKIVSSKQKYVCSLKYPEDQYKVD
jgi:hypothetical protein